MSNADRQKRYRDNKRNAQEPETVTRVTPEPKGALRSDWHTEKGQEILGGMLKQLDEPAPVVNKHPHRPAIPGDSDYTGCCKVVDGVWQVDNTKPDIKDMSDAELIRRLHYIKDWKQSPEHKEVLRRRGGNVQGLHVTGAWA